MPYTLDDIDNAAVAALYAIARDKSPLYEHIGLLYQDGGIKRTPTQSRNQPGTVRGRFDIPRGSLLALFHNHPTMNAMGNAPEPKKFSRDDTAQADALKVPSYIGVNDSVFRYDPATKKPTEVLAEFPWDEMKRKIMVNLLKREPDDPRGPMK